MSGRDYIEIDGYKDTVQFRLDKTIQLKLNACGNPTPHEDNPLGDIKWPAYDLKSKQYLHIDKIIKVEKDLWKYRFNFWDQFLKKWEKRAELGLISKKGDEIKNDEL